jgi:hypothetical protein
MLTIAKLLMRGAALGMVLLVLWASHVLRPDVSVLEAGAVFFILWMCFTFAVVLLASSWVVGRAGQGFKFGKNVTPPTDAEVEALRRKINSLCRVDECEEYTEPGTRYCVAHQVRKAQSDAQPSKVEALRKKLCAMCEVYGCGESRSAGSRYCEKHGDLAAHGGAR